MADPERFSFFRMAKAENVTHPNIVLDAQIKHNGVVYEEQNPRFDEMMAELAIFAKKFV